MVWEIALVVFYIGIAFIFAVISIKLAPIYGKIKGFPINFAKYLQLFLLGLAILFLMMGFGSNKDIITSNNSTLTNTSYAQLIQYNDYGILINVIIIGMIITALFLFLLYDIVVLNKKIVEKRGNVNDFEDL